MQPEILQPVIVRGRSTCRRATSAITDRLGGGRQARVVLVLACVLGLSSADVTTVGASAVAIRHDLSISNTDIGLLIAVTSLVGGLASLPFGILADRIRRTTGLAAAIVIWGVAMAVSALVATFGELLIARVALGAGTAAAGPFVASLVGDYFAPEERGRIYGYILAGELLGAGFGFGVAGGLAALSWRASFLALSLPAMAVAILVARLPEPPRGARDDAEPSATDTAGDRVLRRLVEERGIEPAVHRRPEGSGLRGFLSVARYILTVRTNMLLIGASACGYFFLAGAETFGVEFVKDQYGVSAVLANPLLLLAGTGAVAGVLAGGWLADETVRWGYATGRIVVSAGSAALAALLFLPAILSGSAAVAVPLLGLAAIGLAAQNPPLDAARLDIMPAPLWGRAESVRTLLRTALQAAAPLAFGVLSDYLFGGGRRGLQFTFLTMLVPLALSALLLLRARATYLPDVAAAAEYE